MNAFHRPDGRLHVESVSLERIADDVGTPFYCYSTAILESRYRALDEALAGLPATICFAVKANGNIAVVSTLARLGAGADVVSAGELTRALRSGIPASRIVFSGVGKTDDEMAAALDAGVMQINVESEVEMEALSRVATARGVTAPSAVRVNPDVDARTHEKITTGRRENKFGIEWARVSEVFAAAAALPGIALTGVAVHIGSQLTDLEPFRHAFRRIRGLVTDLRAQGHRIDCVDVGGGLGIDYGDPADEGTGPPSAADYAAVVRDEAGDLDCQLLLEPGRYLAGNAGVLVTRVVYVKEGETRRFLIVDAAMNDLLRPALYGAYHRIEPVGDIAGGDVGEFDVVGPVCETGDTFATQRSLPRVEPGALLCVHAAGAYGAVMASTYNARPLVPEVLVKDGAYAVVRRRVPVEEALTLETVPDWLSAPATRKKVS
ncbi:MAG: diaminopimelate decarboxylase [Rhodospirillales bacterium]|jgi:diaminopimelate decarboxylase|nr:diaminopimelate decarboxylase [Rhodospirillales bacterium]HJO96443.1 diaminopimelate decarboxylase [Rhodospirillales bacterium]